MTSTKLDVSTRLGESSHVAPSQLGFFPLQTDLNRFIIFDNIAKMPTTHPLAEDLEALICVAEAR